jgi:hypothetical protein
MSRKIDFSLRLGERQAVSLAPVGVSDSEMGTETNGVNRIGFGSPPKRLKAAHGHVRGSQS